MSRVHLTVAIPARDAAATIGAALESVLVQADEAVEILVANDASSDDTCDVVRRVGGGRVRVVHGRGRGVAAARNLLVREARGPWVAFLDADDRWLPGRIDALRRTIRQDPGAAVCFGAARHVDERGRLITVFEAPLAHATLAGLLRRRLQPTTSATAVRRSTVLAVGGFLEEFRVKAGVEDVDLWWRLAKEGRCLVQPEPLVEYVVHDNRDAARSAAVLEDLRADRHRSIARLAGEVEPRLWRAAAAQHHAVMARYWLNAGMREEARTDARASLRHRLTLAGVGALALSALPRAAIPAARRARRRALRARDLTGRRLHRRGQTGEPT